MGKYVYNEKEKIVCGCEDFTDNDNVLYEFESLALSTNPDKKIGIVCVPINEKGVLRVQLPNKKIWINFHIFFVF